jgi:cysteine desulfurase
VTIYLDNAATAPVRREVLESMWPYLTAEYGNPSSHHEVGESAARGLADARARVATVLGCRAAEVIFTGGGTESNNLAIKGLALADPRGRHIVTSAVEHPAVLESCAYLERFHDFEVTIVGVDGEGMLDLEAFDQALRPDTTLVSVMYANNEVGSVQPLGEVSRLTRATGVPLHSDAVQAAGWLPLDVDALGVEALTIAGHKLGAPKGVGALFVRRGIRLEPLLHGGGQESGRRSGTENVAAIVGLARALELAEQERLLHADTLTHLRDDFIAEIVSTVPGAILTGHPVRRLPGSASFCFAGTSGEAVLLELEQRGITCSSGSACAAGSDEPSSVLTAMGIGGELAQTAVRFTLAATTTRDQLASVATAVREAVSRVQGIAG